MVVLAPPRHLIAHLYFQPAGGHSAGVGAPPLEVPREVFRVLVVDDDYLVREGARSVLSSVPGVEVVGLAANPTELATKIDETHPQVVVLDPKGVDGRLEAQRRRAHSRLQGMTEREHEVLGLMASGRNNAAIARDLVLSERAVEKHINSIFRKLGLSEQLDVNQRVAAVLFFLQRSH